MSRLNPRPFIIELVALVILTGLGFVPACAKAPSVPDVDRYVRLACEGLAYQVAAETGADVRLIIENTCIAEELTRALRDRMLRSQLARPQVITDAGAQP